MKEGKRKGESEGARLTPGERAINWAKVIAIIVPLFGAGVFAGNTQTIKQYLPDFVGEVDEPVSDDIHPEVKQKLSRLIELINEHTLEFEKVREEIKKARSQSHHGDNNQNKRLEALEKLVN